MREGWIERVMAGAFEADLEDARGELAAVMAEVATCAAAARQILATTRPDRPLTVDHQRALDGMLGRTTESLTVLHRHVAPLRAKVWDPTRLARLAAWLTHVAGAAS